MVEEGMDVKMIARLIKVNEKEVRNGLMKIYMY